MQKTLRKIRSPFSRSKTSNSPSPMDVTLSATNAPDAKTMNSEMSKVKTAQNPVETRFEEGVLPAAPAARVPLVSAVIAPQLERYSIATNTEIPKTDPETSEQVTDQVEVYRPKVDAAPKGKGPEIIPAGIDDPKHKTSLSEAQEQLQKTTEEFKENYTKFATKNGLLLIDGESVRNAITTADTVTDIRESARIFASQITIVLRLLQQKKAINDAQLTGCVSNFLSKYYPLARLSLGVASAVAEGIKLAPLQGAANGLILILDVLSKTNASSDDFFVQLNRLQYQADRVAANPNFDVIPDSTRNIVQVKGTDLMSAIISFFNSALLHFGRGFGGRILNTITEGTKGYDEGKNLLQMAIDHYDQAVHDLTAAIVAELRMDQKTAQSQLQDEQFLKWLSPSYWLVEGQLTATRNQRASGTLQWLRNVKEIRDWQSRDASGNGQTLWIKGAPGVGKSIIAGYLIDYLRCGYPDAIVAYFFCKQGQTGLTSVRDIIRTLVYYLLIDSNSGMRPALEKLKNSGFDLESKVGISLLSKKLIKEPLLAAGKDVYIVIDGLDEADYDIRDDIERRPQLDILIECLASLPSCRLLVVSRPPSDVLKIVPLATARSVTIKDNRDDIQMYVERIVQGSERLKTHFETEFKAVQYFVEQSHGIFLWVTLVLQQLSNAKSRSAFEDSLKRFSQAPGDMDKLYANVLSKLHAEDQSWAKEILKWVLVSKRAPTIAELEGAVNHSLNDDRIDFKDFIEVTCGSFLRFVPRSSLDDFVVDMTVQVVHETFRSFLIDSTSICPDTFFIDLATSNTEAAILCLDIISTSDHKHPLWDYASSRWVDQMLSQQGTRQPEKMLVRLHRFFTSDGVRYLVNVIMKPSSFWDDSLFKFARLLKDGFWDDSLVKLAGLLKDAFKTLDNLVESTLIDDELKTAFDWRETILREPCLLGELLGKAAANMWLAGHISCLDELAELFQFALQHYWKTTVRKRSNEEEIKRFVATNFEDLALWAGMLDKIPIKSKSLGVGFFVLHRWEEAVRSLKHSSDDFDTWLYIGLAYGANDNYKAAIEAFERAILHYPSDSEASQTGTHPIAVFYALGNVLKANGDPFGEVAAMRRAIPKLPNRLWFWDDLFGVFKIHNSLEDVVVLYQKAVEMNPRNLWALSRIGDAYSLKREHDLEIAWLQKTYELALELFPNDKKISLYFSSLIPQRLEGSIFSDLDSRATNTVWLQLELRLAEAYIGKGDFDSAINSLERTQNKFPQVTGEIAGFLDEVRLAAGAAYKLARNFNKALEIYSSISKTCTIPTLKFEIAEAYFSTGDLGQTVELLISDPSDRWNCLQDFSKWLEDTGKFDLSVRFLEAVHENDFWTSCTVSIVAQSTALVPTLGKNIPHIYDAPGGYNLLSLPTNLPHIYDTPGGYNLPSLLTNGSKETLISLFDRLGELHSTKYGFKAVVELYESALVNKNLSIQERLQLLDRLGRTYQVTNDLDAMLQVYSKCHDLITANNISTVGWPLDQLGAAYHANGQFDSAIDAYEDSINRGGDCWNQLWDVYETKGDISGVVKRIEDMAGRGKIPSRAWRKVASSFVSVGHRDRAMKLFEILQQQMPTAAWP